VALSVEIVQPRSEEWDARVLALGGGPFHVWAWREVCRANGFEPLCVELRDGSDVAGLGIATAHASRWPLLGRWRNALALQTTPALVPEVSRAEALLALASFARRQGCATLRVAPYADPQPHDRSLPEHPGLSSSPAWEFRIPTTGLDDALRRMHPKHRRAVVKALKAGLVCEEDASLAGAMQLRALQSGTEQRRREQGQARWMAWDVNQYRREMAAWVGAGAIRFFLASRQGAALSGAALLIVPGRAYFLAGGTSPEGYACGAAFAVFGHILGRLPALGVAELNLSGVPHTSADPNDPDHGLYRFKHRFGGEPIETLRIEWRLRE
jgi:hypothetical protein